MLLKSSIMLSSLIQLFFEPPTCTVSLSSSFYRDFFRLAKEGHEKGFPELKEHPKTILHVLDVDDCGDAYVALAEHA